MRGSGWRLAVIGLAASAMLGVPGTPGVAGDLCGPRSVSIGDATVTESAGLMNFTVFSSGCAGGTVKFQAVAGAAGYVAATAGIDFVATSGQLSWTAGDTGSKMISVSIIDGAGIEPDEGLTLNLHSSTGPAIVDDSGQGVVLDDDGPNSSLDFSEPFCGMEDCVACWIRVTLDRPVPFPVSVELATENGSATSGRDFVAVDTRVTFPAGVTLVQAQVRILDDAEPEPTENLFVSISRPSAGQIAVGRVAIFIIDNDG